MMSGYNKVEKFGSRCELVFLEKLGLVLDMFDFINLFRCGFSICMCVL